MPMAMAPVELRNPIAALGESAAALAIAPAITRTVIVGDPRTRDPIKRPVGNRTSTRSGDCSVSGWVPRPSARSWALTVSAWLAGRYASRAEPAFAPPLHRGHAVSP